jgi:hypothetical protein
VIKTGRPAPDDPVTTVPRANHAASITNSPLIKAIATMSRKKRPRRSVAQRRAALAFTRKVTRQVWVRFQIKELLREIDTEDDHDRRD